MLAFGAPADAHREGVTFTKSSRFPKPFVASAFALSLPTPSASVWPCDSFIHHAHEARLLGTSTCLLSWVAVIF